MCALLNTNSIILRTFFITSILSILLSCINYGKMRRRCNVYWRKRSDISAVACNPHPIRFLSKSVLISFGVLFYPRAEMSRWRARNDTLQYRLSYNKASRHKYIAMDTMIFPALMQKLHYQQRARNLHHEICVFQCISIYHVRMQASDLC